MLVVPYGECVSNQKANLIHAMLEKNCVSYAEIGRRVGLTRERIRQVAKDMGFDSGGTRMAQCAMSRAAVGTFFEVCTSKGLSVELVRRNTKGNTFFSKIGYVSGRLCKTRAASFRSIRGNIYVHIYCKYLEPFDVLAALLPDNTGRYLVLPADKVPASAIMFSLNPKIPGGRGKAHHYRDYIEKWSVLNYIANYDDGIVGFGREDI